jgi:hypothetical protein
MQLLLQSTAAAFRTAAHMAGFFVAEISFNKGVGIQGNLS